MEFSVTPLLTYVIAWGSTMGAVWFLFDKAEETLKGETKEAISQWLRNVDPSEALHTWPTTFGTVFDYIFGQRHLSWRCFSRSSVASLTAVAILTFMWFGLGNNEEEIPLSFILEILIFSTLLNLIPDYFSLLETRYIIHWMASARATISILVLLVIDLVVTAMIFLVGFTMSLLIYEYEIVMSLPVGDSVSTLWFLVWEFGLYQALFSNLGLSWLAIFFYSTFFTSVWVWLYAASGLTVKFAKFLGVGFSWFRVYLDIENKPLRSMGFVSIALISLLFLVLPFVR